MRLKPIDRTMTHYSTVVGSSKVERQPACQAAKAIVGEQAPGGTTENTGLYEMFSSSVSLCFTGKCVRQPSRSKMAALVNAAINI
jgi:hypothetical protein